MSLRHVVLFRFAPETTPDQVAALSEGLSGLPLKIAEIRAYRHGPDAGISATSWDYALIADFDSAEKFQAYRDHPDHVRVIREIIDPMAAERVSVQLTID
jgi:hypothetical protein